MNELSTTESRELERCEATIEAGLQTFVEVGTALLKIREGRLYRATHRTFFVRRPPYIATSDSPPALGPAAPATRARAPSSARRLFTRVHTEVPGLRNTTS